MFELNSSKMGVTGQIFPGGKRRWRADMQLNDLVGTDPLRMSLQEEEQINQTERQVTLAEAQ